MTDKNWAVITGATGGIGAAITRRLAEAGFGVTIVGRSERRLLAAREQVVDTVPGADISLEYADLSLLTDVRALADRLTDGPPPDVVISNAAVVADLDDVTSEGIQRTLATNHLAPYVLLRSLAERFADYPARYVIVGASPAGLARVPVDLDDLSSRRGLGPIPSFRPFLAYARTKNMNAMFTYALARRIEGTRITVNGAHPGIISGTALGRSIRGTLRFLDRLSQPFLPGPDVGADTPAWLATSPDLDDVSGRFFVKRHEVPTASHTTDVARCERLWEVSARLTGLASDRSAPGPAPS